MMNLIELNGVVRGYLYAIGCVNNDELHNKFKCTYHYDYNNSAVATHLKFGTEAEITMFWMKMPSRDEMKRVINLQYSNIPSLQQIGRALRINQDPIMIVDYI